MANTFTTNTGLIKQTTGENNNTWGDFNNTDQDIADLLIGGFLSVSITSGDVTLANVDGVADDGKNHMFKTTGVLTGNRALIVPTKTRHYIIWNTNTGAFTMTVKTAAGTGVIVPQNTIMQVFCDGTNIVQATTGSNNLYIGQNTKGVYTNATSGAAVSLDLSLYNIFDVTLTANCTFTFTNPPVSGIGEDFTLILRQNGTGGYSATFPASVTAWQGTTSLITPPTLTTTANYISVLSFITVDNGTSYAGWLQGSGSSGGGGGGVSPVNGTYIAVGTSGKVSSSTDGSTWTARTPQFSGNNIAALAYQSGYFDLATTQTTTTPIVYTTTGASFSTAATLASSGTYTGFASNSVSAVLFGTLPSSNPAFIPVIQGTTLNAVGVGQSTSFSNSPVLVANDGGANYLAVKSGLSQTNFDYSVNNATTFTTTGLNHSVSNASATITVLAYAGGYWLLGYADGSICYKSSIASTTLTSVSSVIGSFQLNKFIYTGTKWIAAGNAGKLCNASSIGTWTSRATALSGNITGLAYSGGVTMMCTDQGELARSTDNGDTWTVLTSPTNNPFGGSALLFLRYELTKFWTGGAGGKLGASTDGQTFGLVAAGFGTDTIIDMVCV